MIEIFRKGFRLDISPTQIVTFKKAQNLNGVQARYSYSNTGSMDKTANNIKLLDLTHLPMGKAQTMQNGYEVDIVLNGSIFLRNQILKITKESLDKVDFYILYADSMLVSKLKSTYINDVVADIKYKKTRDDFGYRAFFGFDPLFPSVFVQTQSPAGQYVAEEMPILINLQWLIKEMLQDNGYTLYGDFALDSNTIKDYYVAPNQGVYQVYSGTGDGFSPVFASDLTAFDLLNQTLAYFNCYADVDDTYRNVVINLWSNLSNYKNDYVDYSKYFVNYQDYTFQSKLAKRNEMTYADSDETFNSYFSNPLSSEESASYLDSKFGSGSTALFDDSEVNDDLTIPVRANGELGETSAVRIYKISPDYSYFHVYEDGFRGFAPVQARRAVSVSMREVYNSFHKAYTDFILTPLIQNVIFRYDDILAASFSMTKVFFIEQLASYWIPLEINFSTNKDKIIVKSMLVKPRKVVSPTLNNFNSVLLDFRQRVIFPNEYLLSMYPMPPNQYPWEEIIFKGYDGTKNSLYVNGVFVPANSLPQAFPMAGIVVEFEADLPGDTIPNTLTDSMYIQAIDSNGGISNDAYITLKHTGVANLESNFRQPTAYVWEGLNVEGAGHRTNVLEYVVGSRPNINSTITSVTFSEVPDAGITTGDPSFDLIDATQAYTNVKLRTLPFYMKMNLKSLGVITTVEMKVRVYAQKGGTAEILGEYIGTAPVLGETETEFDVPAFTRNYASMAVDERIKVYLWVYLATHGPQNCDARLEVSGMGVDISTTINP
jgi:hypothetical protein